MVAEGRLLSGEVAADDYAADESLTVRAQRPAAVAVPVDTGEVSRILGICGSSGIPVTGRGAGTGLSGAAVPGEDALVVSFEAMNAILEVDTDNHVAVVQPGIRLNELDEVLTRYGLVYPVYPGEYSASLGGNVNTNAGGMRAVKYGVTRHHVLGLEVVLAHFGELGLDLPGLVLGNGFLDRLAAKHRELLDAMNAKLNALIDREVGEDGGQMLPGNIDGGWVVTDAVYDV